MAVTSLTCIPQARQLASGHGMEAAGFPMVRFREAKKREAGGLTPSCQARGTADPSAVCSALGWSVIFPFVSPFFFIYSYLSGGNSQVFFGSTELPACLLRAPPAQPAAPMHDDLDEGTPHLPSPTSQDTYSIPTLPWVFPTISRGDITPVGRTTRDASHFSFTSGQDEDPSAHLSFPSFFFFFCWSSLSWAPTWPVDAGSLISGPYPGTVTQRKEHARHVTGWRDLN
ncbi:hypothetical protein MAPG_08629 [Magnaporthiopsis poae ATCC 64411]|uniref:Uncharacterized protein n=1 Tax=Magnaporthiopsis poae (strain ATCC 64411 / 73-15) TaxID=644358 RepID=A0A0C4E7V4_MAGP6|nr:hypothetical protein MAPG_08629 [Magnaporthiopsis poae ATCC 64411]